MKGGVIIQTLKRTSNDLHTGSVASVHHVLVLCLATTLRLKLVAYRLIVGPPLGALDMLADGAHLDVAISCVAGSVPAG